MRSVSRNLDGADDMGVSQLMGAGGGKKRLNKLTDKLHFAKSIVHRNVIYVKQQSYRTVVSSIAVISIVNDYIHNFSFRSARSRDN